MSFTNDKDADNYATDKKGWEMIKEYIPTDKQIWSPFYCDGKQKEYFKEMGFDIIHEDKDFFSYTPDYEVCIDNAPFSKLKDICIRLKELDKPFILILPASTITTQYIRQLFKNDNLQIIIPRRRIHFDKKVDGKTPENWKNACNFDCFYYCYKMYLNKDIIFLD